MSIPVPVIVTGIVSRPLDPAAATRRASAG